MLLYFQTLSTLYLEANHKVPSSGFHVLSMSESDFSELVAPHETAFVNIAVYSVEFALTRILPHFEISTIAQYRCASYTGQSSACSCLACLEDSCHRNWLPYR